MTITELFPKYVELFILVMEAAGQKTGNAYYTNVEKIIKREDSKAFIEGFLKQDPPFPVMITILEFLLIKEMRGIEGAEELSIDSGKDLVDDMFERYLKKPTRKFTSTYGLSPVVELDTYFKVIIKTKEEDEKF